MMIFHNRYDVSEQNLFVYGVLPTWQGCVPCVAFNCVEGCNRPGDEFQQQLSLDGERDKHKCNRHGGRGGGGELGNKGGWRDGTASAGRRRILLLFDTRGLGYSGFARVF